MLKSSGQPKSTKAQGKPSNSENLDQTNRGPVLQEVDTAAQKPATDSEGTVRSREWRSPSAPVGEWAKPADSNLIPGPKADSSEQSAGADVYFCGRTTLFPLNRALQAIAKEELTGALRAFWDQEPIELFFEGGHHCFRHDQGSRSLLRRDPCRTRERRCENCCEGTRTTEIRSAVAGVAVLQGCSASYPAAPATARMTAFLEVKTVWHTVGV